jgi:hypothetical protein
MCKQRYVRAVERKQEEEDVKLSCDAMIGNVGMRRFHEIETALILFVIPFHSY